MTTTRAKRVVEDELQAYWGRASRFDAWSIMYHHGGGDAHRADARCLADAIEGDRHQYLGFDVRTERSYASRFAALGYDLKSLRFRIRTLSCKSKLPRRLAGADLAVDWVNGALRYQGDGEGAACLKEMLEKRHQGISFTGPEVQDSFIEELSKRGYDIATLELRIMKNR